MTAPDDRAPTPCIHEWFEGKCVHCHETPEGHIAELRARCEELEGVLDMIKQDVLSCNVDPQVVNGVPCIPEDPKWLNAKTADEFDDAVKERK